jgi:hypothetical protein
MKAYSFILIFLAVCVLIVSVRLFSSVKKGSDPIGEFSSEHFAVLSTPAHRDRLILRELERQTELLEQIKAELAAHRGRKGEE